MQASIVDRMVTDGQKCDMFFTFSNVFENYAISVIYRETPTTNHSAMERMDFKLSMILGIFEKADLCFHLLA